MWGFALIQLLVCIFIQIRCVFKVPLYISGPCQLKGHLQLEAHNRQSYTVHVTLQGPPLGTNQPPQTVRSSVD